MFLKAFRSNLKFAVKIKTYIDFYAKYVFLVKVL